MTTRDSATVHVVAYALWPTLKGDKQSHSFNPWTQALAALPMNPSLQTLSHTSIHPAPPLPADSPCGAHELAFAQALGWSVPPSLLPMAAWQAAQLGLAGDADPAWAFIDLVNCEFNQGRVRIRLPQGLSSDDSLAFMHAMQGFFLEDGIALHPVSPGRFLARSSIFAGLPCVTTERACLQDMHALHDVAELSTQTPAQRLLRRLQNEMQMLLYTHALNADRAQTINSFWVSGCGELPTHTRTNVQLHMPLREAYLQHDTTAWAATWSTLAQQLLAPALLQGERVVLCGVDRCLTLQASATPWWQRLWPSLRPVSWVERLS